MAKPNYTFAKRQKEIAKKKNQPFEEALKESEKSIPINRFASVEEIAKTASFLTSEDGSYITNSNLS
ncbi:MAG: SDR family oxidoreductase, partial [Alteromonadaceae bacterium]